MNARNLQSYSPSGKLSVSLVWYFVFFSAVICAIAYLLSLLIIQFPQVFISVPVFFLKAFIVGLCSVYLIRWSKIRNSGIGFLTGLLLGVLSWLSGWLFLAPGMLKSFDIHLSTSELLNKPELLIENLHLLVTSGWYQILDYRINGFVIQGAWIIEMAALIVYPAYKGFDTAKNRLFCEGCNQWAEDQGGMLAFYYQAEDKLIEDFKSGSFEFMDAAEAIYNVPMKDYYQINSEVCVACNDRFALSLYQMKKATDIDKPKPRLIHDKLLVKRPYFQHFLMLRSQFPAPEES